MAMSIEEQKRSLALILADQAEVLTPLYEAADGVKATLAGRGWSPTAAEAAALTWLQGMTQLMFVHAAASAATPAPQS